MLGKNSIIRIWGSIPSEAMVVSSGLDNSVQADGTKQMSVFLGHDVKACF